MGLSFWLVPTKKDDVDLLCDGMKDVRAFLAEQASLGGAIASAPFPPHVTLLTGIDRNLSQEHAWKTFEEAVEAWRSEENGRNSIVCPFESVTSNGLYFQCIVIALRLDACDGLVRLNEIMRQRFGLADQEPYWPHASLAYAHLTKDTALAYIRELERNGIFKKSTDGIAFGKGAAGPMTAVSLGAVELWQTGDDVGQWRMLDRQAL